MFIDEAKLDTLRSSSTAGVIMKQRFACERTSRARRGIGTVPMDISAHFVPGIDAAENRMLFSGNDTQQRGWA